jgi:hypothetical protein
MLRIVGDTVQQRQQRADRVDGTAKARRYVTVDYEYIGGRDFDATLERGPLVKAWLAGLPTPAGEPVPVHRHKLVPADASAQRYAPVEVSFPYHESEWPQDACIRFLLFDQIQNSEGDWTYEKAASGEAFLADLLAKNAGEKARVDMRVQSYYMPTMQDRKNQRLFEQRRHKGKLLVGRRSTHPDVTWAPPTGVELIPRNYPHLQAAMMMAVGQNMALFNPEIVGAKTLRPTLAHEIDNVHAPLYVQETPVGVRGSWFFTATPLEARAHITGRHDGVESAKDYYETLIKQSLRRHDMSRAEFLEAGRIYAGVGDSRARRKLTDHQLRIAGAVLATGLTQRVNMMSYVADKVVLGGGTHEEPVVESFDNVDDRTAMVGDFGGARSRDLGGARTKIGGEFMGRARGERRVASGGAMDCEDGAKDALVHFSTLVDPGVLPDADVSDRPLLVAARRIGQHYRGVAILSSVLSRNLTDATASMGHGKEAEVTIGSRADTRVQVGAHMFAVLIPEETLRRNITSAMKAYHPPHQPGGAGRTKIGAPMRSRGGHAGGGHAGGGHTHPPAKVDLGTPTPMAIGAPSSAGGAKTTVLGSGDALPALLCEGTGVLHPLMVPWDGYERPADFAGRRAAVTRSLLGQEAELRMRVGQSSDDIVAKRGHAAPPKNHPALSKFKPMHSQKDLVDHPHTRLVKTFYRTAAEAYLVPTARQLQDRLEDRAAVSSPDTGAPVLVGDQLIPVQLGDRYARTTNSKGVRPTWGVAVSDILRSSELVGFVPTPHPSPIETKIVHQVSKHIAPANGTWHLDLENEKDPEADPFIVAAKRWPGIFQQTSGLATPVVRRKGMPKTRYVMAHAYGDPRKLHEKDVVALGSWMKRNPYVIAASLNMEYGTYHLATVRLDALVDCGNTATQSQTHIGALLKRAPKRGDPPKSRGTQPLGGAAASRGEAGGVSPFHRNVVKRFQKTRRPKV